jgi:hydrogenase expression/formation protein HypD
MLQSKQILNQIHSLAKEISRPVALMEVCGTHTQAIARYGLRKLLPENLKLITGPGCPVCVTAQKDIDAMIALALAGIPIASYGDALRVPGAHGSLEKARANGAKVFTVYSTTDALGIKKNYSDLVFFGLGFETTAPATAYAIKNGLTVYSAHKLFLPAMEALLQMGEIKIDGFLAPGHVSAIIGVEPYRKMKAPQVITGFTEEDVLVGIHMLLQQILDGRAEVENQYLRAVKEKGNPIAYDLIFEVFKKAPGLWRGFGLIPDSGLEIKEEYQEFDAKEKYKKILNNIKEEKELAGCACGEIIRGLKSPADCQLFKKVCSPENPIGPCMVSVEGACNVEFTYL